MLKRLSNVQLCVRPRRDVPVWLQDSYVQLPWPLDPRAMPSITNLRRIARRNVQVLRSSPLSELSGAFGDLGTLLPLLVAMTLSHSISLPASLLFMGASNVLTGFLFGIPLPVQPMKAIASIAIARNFTLEETAAAGIGVSAVVGILSVTGLLHKAAIVVPIPVVKVCLLPRLQRQSMEMRCRASRSVRGSAWSLALGRRC